MDPDSVHISPLDIGKVLSPISSPVCDTIAPAVKESPQCCPVKAESTEPEASFVSKKEEFPEIKDAAADPEGSSDCKNDPGDILQKAEYPASDDLQKTETDKSPVENGVGSNPGDGDEMTTPEKTLKVQSSCWASFSKALNTIPVTIKSSSDSFQQFRKAAIAKEERERAMRAQELKRQQELQSDRGDRETKEKETSDSASTKTRSPDVQPLMIEEVTKDPQTPETTSPEARAEEERALARKKEQEKRRRESMAGTIDMYLQSDIMADFEEYLC
ncbi:bromodomain testis-specific protein-like [Dendropsophus ebraccatus]|uniref:bromodomain testis-specific protein-like n=1 Tax=Dendropsophus ebraccatus TaxID=150705 RepID=UPI0038314EE5